MVTATARTVLAMAMAAWRHRARGVVPNRRRSVPSALAKGKYPWYDAQGDAFKPVWPPREPDFNWLDRLPKFGKIGSIGELITIGLAMLALAVLLVVLVELWRRYRPVEAPSGARPSRDWARRRGSRGCRRASRPGRTTPGTRRDAVANGATMPVPSSACSPTSC